MLFNYSIEANIRCRVESVHDEVIEFPLKLFDDALMRQLDEKRLTSTASPMMHSTILPNKVLLL